MSSSLDDLEPYEFFQQQLDEYLKDFIRQNQISKREELIINQFIEYITFYESIHSKDQINSSLIIIVFPKHLNSLFPNIFNPNEITRVVLDYIAYIKNP